MTDKAQKTEMEARFIRESGVAARIADIVEPVIEDMDYQLVHISVQGAKYKHLVIMVDKSEGAISLADCETLTHAISPILDAQDPIEGKYFLEISSPGIERPLVRLSDFKTRIGTLIHMEMKTPIEGRRKFRGYIEDVSQECIILRLLENQTQSNGASDKGVGNSAIKAPHPNPMSLPTDDIAKAFPIGDNIIDLFKEHKRRKGPVKKNNTLKSMENTHGSRH